MSVKCGNRKAHNGTTGIHESASEVRACYAGRSAQEAVAAQADWVRRNYIAVPGEWEKVDPRVAQAGDFAHQGGEWVEIASVAQLRGNTKFAFVGGGSHTAPTHFWSVRRRVAKPFTPAEERSFDDVYREHEDRQERAAYESKMARDDAMLQAAMKDATDDYGREHRGALRMPTEPMLELIRKLREERGLPPLKFSGTFSQARVEIERLKALPRVKTSGKAPVKYPKVADGRYAVEHEGVLKFYRVKRVERGSEPGRFMTYLDVQASDAWWPVKKTSTKLEVLELIAKDEKGAMLRYGHELGACGHCGRTLTDEDSRARGIGPICAGKLGW